MSNLTRRGFVQLGSLGLAGLSMPEVLMAREAQAPTARKDTAVILYWMGGGPSHIDTFDPKPNAPVECRGPFGSVQAAPGMRICELLPNLARIGNKFSLVRSMAHYDSNHNDAAHLVQTGIHERDVQFRGQIHPAQGSFVAKIRGSNKPNIPPYVCIPDAYFARQGFFQQATYLGKEFDPVNSGSEPTFRFTNPGPSFTLPADITADRAHGRKLLLDKLNTSNVNDGLDAAYRKAFDLIMSRAAKEAFNLSREPERLRERYGHTPWGRGALLARRLVEAGVTFVTVNHYEADVDWWDDHYDIEKNLKRRLPFFDRALGALIEDIHARGLAERVMVVAMGEFGRSPKIDALAGRGHWAKAMSVLVAGGGVKGGRVIGATTANGGEPASDPHVPGDMLATIYQHLGIDPTDMLPDRQNRPIRLVEHGEPIRELF
ncbi:MAG: DUF1501 domain-containing protein [Planctomycetes bacterium]|nr:DUF1501 domain-containing protein [Planctomycetota bacterium]